MERVVIVGVMVLVAAVVAVIVERRSRPDAPTQPPGSVPSQLDRADFAAPVAPWLIAAFTSRTCRSCAAAVEMVREVAGDLDDVAVDDIESSARPDLHERYAIDAVPTIVIADAQGVVKRAFLGPPTSEDLRAALSEAREPGSTSRPDAGRLLDGSPPSPE